MTDHEPRTTRDEPAGRNSAARASLATGGFEQSAADNLVVRDEASKRAVSTGIGSAAIAAALLYARRP